MPPQNVQKRSGKLEPFSERKIAARLRALAAGLKVDVAVVVADTVAAVPAAGPVTTRQLDELAANYAAFRVQEHPDYGRLAARVTASDVRKSVAPSFSAYVAAAYEHVNHETHRHAPLVSAEFAAVVATHAAELDAAVDHARDDLMGFFAHKTLQHAYLLKTSRKVLVETPQYLWMRVAVGIHGEDLAEALHTYDILSRGLAIHATPTLFNAGTPRPQMSSCFLFTMRDDSIRGIYGTLGDCADVSKCAGGVALDIASIRAKGSYVAGSQGHSNGIVPMLKVFEASSMYVDQGGGRRKGSCAVYLQPWHADVEDFLLMKRNAGKDRDTARALFYALWIPDLFFKRLEADADWSLFCPSTAPGLAGAHGEEFEALYTRLEKEGLARRVLKATELWAMVTASIIETGMPYLLAKDACNRRSPQRHLGPIRCSNLCTEIVQYTAPDTVAPDGTVIAPGETAVCNLAAVVLPRFVDETTRTFDFAAMGRVVAALVRNLDRIVDRNYYPTERTRASNLRHRPMGIGVHGLADAYAKMGLPFESEKAAALNRDIFETMYFEALRATVALARERGPHESFQGSPASRGELQFDHCPTKPNPALGLDWEGLRADMKEYGVRNALLIALMPTASTSNITGCSPCIEPRELNVLVRNVLAGNFVVLNPLLVEALERRGLWSTALSLKLVQALGSVQDLAEVPEDIKALFKTAYEVPQKALVRQAAERGAFVDQSQSLNLFMAAPDHKRVTKAVLDGWRRGLKTLTYYLNSQPAAEADARAALTEMERRAQAEGTAAAPAQAQAQAAAPPAKRRRGDGDGDGETAACALRRGRGGAGDCLACSS